MNCFFHSTFEAIIWPLIHTAVLEGVSASLSQPLRVQPKMAISSFGTRHWWTQPTCLHRRVLTSDKCRQKHLGHVQSSTRTLPQLKNTTHWIIGLATIWEVSRWRGWEIARRRSCLEVLAHGSIQIHRELHKGKMIDEKSHQLKTWDQEMVGIKARLTSLQHSASTRNDQMGIERLGHPRTTQAQWMRSLLVRQKSSRKEKSQTDPWRAKMNNWMRRMKLGVMIMK